MTDSYASTNGSLVYVIQAETSGPVKVGVTKAIKRRIAEIQTGSPYEISLIGWFPCGSQKEAYEVEGKIHKTIAQHRMHGEWFKFSSLPKIFVMQGFVVSGNDSGLTSDHIKRLSVSACPEWCYPSLHSRKARASERLSKPKNGNIKSPLTGMSEKILAIHSIVDGFPDCSDSSSRDLKLFCRVRVRPPMWDSVYVDHGGSIVCMWAGDDNERFSIEFRGNDVAICEIHIDEIEAEGVSLSRIDAALYLSAFFSLASKNRRKKIRLANGVRRHRATLRKQKEHSDKVKSDKKALKLLKDPIPVR